MNNEDSTNFFGNPHYLAYIRLLGELHALIREDKDEEPEGDAIREQMDEPGSQLSKDEIESVNGVSADLYSLFDPQLPALSQTNEIRASLKRAVDSRDTGDLHTALTQVRKYSRYIEPAVLAYLRGTIWMEQKEHALALQFFQRAAELDPINQNYEYLLINEFSKVNSEAAIVLAEQIIKEPNLHHSRVVLKALELFFYATKEQSDEASRLEREALLSVFDETIFRMETAGETGSQLAMAFALAGFCYESLDQLDQALAYYDRGLSIVPSNEALLVARGILLYGGDTKKAVHDFAQAISNGTQLVWPYFFLAHHSLIQDLYEDTLRYCAICERLATTPTLLANVLEWAAISHSSLGSSELLIEAIFGAALTFDPGNARISRNHQAFKDSLRPVTPTIPIRWDKGDEGSVQSVGKAEFRIAA